MAAHKEENSQENQNRNSKQWLQRIRTFLINKLFKINHVLLDNQPLGSPIFQILMLFEFIQLMFFVFHKVPIVNEFAIVESDSLTNSSMKTQDVSGVKQAIGSDLDQSNILRLDLNILFANFQLYALESHSISTFLGVYGFLNILFYGCIFGMLGFAEQSFRALNRDDLKDSNSLAVKTLSLIVTLFLTIFFIPMITLNIQGFLCNEDKDDYYVLDDIKCQSIINDVLIVISTFTIVLFIIFCFLQRQLFTSPNLDSFLPWAQPESNVGIFELAWKLQISLAFMLDKFGTNRKELNLVSFAIGGIICYQRLTISKLHNRRVHEFQTLYTLLATWFFLCIPIHQMVKSGSHEITITTIIALLITGTVISALMIYLSELRDREVFLRFALAHHGEMMKIIKNSKQAENLLYHLLKYIGKTQEQLDIMAVRGISFGGGSMESYRAKIEVRNITLNGIIANHLDLCSQRDCTCSQIFGEMFENKAFLSDTWHLLQEEEFKEEDERKKPKLVKKMSISDNGQYESSSPSQIQKSQSFLKRNSENLSQNNIEEIPSILRDINAEPSTNQQQDDTPPTNNLLNRLQERIHIVVQPFDQIDMEVQEREKLEKLGTFNGPLHSQRSSQLNDSKFNFSFQPNSSSKRDKGNHSSYSRSINDGVVSSSGIGKEDLLSELKNKITMKFQKNVTFGENFIKKEGSKNSCPEKNKKSLIEESKEKDAQPSLKYSEAENNQVVASKALLNQDQNAQFQKAFMQSHNQPGISKEKGIHSPPYETMQTEDESMSYSKPANSLYSHNNNIESLHNNDIFSKANISKYSSHESFEYDKEEKTMKFLFTALVVERAIQKFPKSNELRLHSSLIHSEKLKNEFKAVFELMQCSQNETSLQCSFQIFRRQILIERKVMQKSQENSKLPGRVDPLNTYKYEKLYQRFIRLEYLAANSALSFWKELLQSNHFNTQLLQLKGAQITNCYTQIQQIVRDIERLKPICISLICRYAIFLKRIVNNENEALLNYEKAVGFYQRMLSQKGLLANSGDSQSQGGSNINETAIFGENSACAVIMVSLQIDKVGSIIHTNDEIYRTLGYHRKDIVGQKINKLQPRPVAVVHDSILKRFLSNYKNSKVLNNTLQLYAISNEGYLRPISILVKLYPQISSQITLIGFIQLLQKIDGMDFYPGDTETLSYHALPHHYMIADINHSIDCVSKGLFEETGLCSKFFGSSEQHQHNSIHVEKLFGPEITSGELTEQLANGGLEFQLNTLHLLEYVNSEQLTEEELEAVKQRLGIYRVNVMVKRVVFANEMYLYRIIILPATKESSNRLSKMIMGSHNNIVNCKENNQQVNNHIDFHVLGSNTDGQSDDYYENDLPSQQSGTSSQSVSSGISNTYFKMISDFKSSLGSRETPRYILWLSRLLAVALLLTITISSVEYRMKAQFVEEAELSIGEYLIKSEARVLLFIQLALDVRSIINVANGIEFPAYQGYHLGRIDRFKYLNQIIQKETDELQEIQDYLIRQRGKQQDIETLNVELYRYSTVNTIVTDDVPFKNGFQDYLNNILLFNSSTPEKLQMSLGLIPGSPYLPKNSTNNSGGSFQNELYFNLANQFRDFISSTQYSNDQLFQRLKESSKHMYRREFIVIMIIGIAISFTSFLLILRQIMETERTKKEIMSIFSILSTEDIKQVYDVCDLYLEHNFLGTGKLQEANAEYINRSFMKSAGSSRAGSRLVISQAKKPWEENPKEYYGRMLRETQTLIRDQNFTKLRDVIAQKEKNKVSNNYQAKLLEESKSKKGGEIMKAPTKSKTKLMKRFQIEASKSKKAGLEPNTSQRHLKSDFDSARRDGDKNDKSHSESESEEEKENEQQIKRRQKNQMRKQMQEMDEVNKVQEKSDTRAPRNNGGTAKCFKIIGLNLLMCILFCGYFIFGFVFHISQLKILEEIIQYSPVFCKRYENLYLSYGFLREKIVSQNNPQIFADFHVPNQDPNKLEYQQDIDQYYHEQSMQIEKEIQKLKVLQPKSIAPVIEFFSKTTDSEKFCSHIVGLVQGQAEEKIVLTKNVQQKLVSIRKVAYQKFIDTVIAACTAASEGKLDILKKLKDENNVNLNDGDYDRRTPLHVSCGAGKESVVRYLVEEAKVKINPIDRWGATPLNDCWGWPVLREFMQSRGAKLGKIQPSYKAFEVTVTEDQFRLYYAAYFGDVSMMENLRLLGWNVNGQDYDGRTALGVASSEGHLDVVKYLISKGANVNIQDARGNDALADARRENRTEVINYLLNEALILVYCLNFESQLFSKGVQQVIGVFNRKFEDLQILIDSQKQNTALYGLLGSTRFPLGNQTSDSSTRRIMEVFISTQELYLYKVVERVLQVLQESYTTFAQSYFFTTQIVFFIFLSIQIITLLMQRNKLINTMKEEIIQSRGILNLVPQSFLKEHQDQVQKIMKIISSK